MRLFICLVSRKHNNEWASFHWHFMYVFFAELQRFILLFSSSICLVCLILPLYFCSTTNLTLPIFQQHRNFFTFKTELRFYKPGRLLNTHTLLTKLIFCAIHNNTDPLW